MNPGLRLGIAGVTGLDPNLTRVVATEFPCDPVMVKSFGHRLIEIYPDLQQINTGPDYIMGLYIFAMASCTGRFARMAPEEIGINGEPFFPRAMLAAMVRAGRGVMCPMAAAQAGGR